MCSQGSCLKMLCPCHPWDPGLLCARDRTVAATWPPLLSPGVSNVPAPFRTLGTAPEVFKLRKLVVRETNFPFFTISETFQNVPVPTASLLPWHKEKHCGLRSFTLQTLRTEPLGGWWRRAGGGGGDAGCVRASGQHPRS